MGLLGLLLNVLQKPVRPAGDPLEFARLRESAYRELFGSEPIEVVPHEAFQKPMIGGRVDVRIYELPYERNVGQVQVAVTSGMSDYRMTRDGIPRRREVVQYFREYRLEDVVRLHDMAWLPLAMGFCLDAFETVGPHPSEWPGALFLPSLVKEHADFSLTLNGEEMKMLWLVPLLGPELDFKLENGTDALLQRMQERELPWIFDAANRPALV